LTDLAGFERLVRIRDGSYAADMLIAAVGWLDFFTALSGRTMNAEEIRSAFGLDPRPCDVMLTLFKAWNLLVETPDGRYRITRSADAFLSSTKPGNLFDYYASLKGRSSTKDMLEVLRSGHCRAWDIEQQSQRQEWDALMRGSDFAVHFTAAMDNRGMTFAAALAEILDCDGTRNVLDVAGGSGIYTVSLLSRYPKLRAGIFERPPVDEMTRRFIAARDFAARVTVVTGDMFADPALPEGYDLHLYSHVFHNWGIAKVRSLIGKSFAALAPGGRIAIYSAHVNEAKDGPVAVAEYSALMVSLYEGKCYSVGEMRDALLEAGFGDVTVTNSIADRSLIIARKP
jgi:hypothetical protein